jgi:hypothetical protein
MMLASKQSGRTMSRWVCSTAKLMAKRERVMSSVYTMIGHQWLMRNL